MLVKGTATEGFFLRFSAEWLFEIIYQDCLQFNVANIQNEWIKLWLFAKTAGEKKKKKRKRKKRFLDKVLPLSWVQLCCRVSLCSDKEECFDRKNIEIIFYFLYGNTVNIIKIKTTTT